MAELLFELYSEEIPPQLQIEARSQLKQFIENSFKENNLKYKDLTVYSSPTRLILYAKNLTEKIQIDAKEIKGPKVGSPDQVLQGFIKAKSVSEKDLIEKNLSLPAYDQCLKASHIFNLLDARGVIGGGERTGYITRIRELAKGCGSLWLSSQN